MLRKIIFIALSFLILSGCIERNTKKALNQNIDELNDFYRSHGKDSENKILIYKTKESLQNRCKKATINAKNVTLKELTLLLEQIYKVDINYSSNLTQPATSKPETSKSATSKPATSKAPSIKNEQKDAAPIDDKIDIVMSNVCIEDVIDNLVENLDVGIKQTEQGYSVYPKQLRTEIFSVNYHNFHRQGKSSITITKSKLQTEGDPDNFSSIISTSEEEFWKSINQTLRSILSSDKERSLAINKEGEQAIEDFYVYKESGLIVVTAYPKQLNYIRKFLNKVNDNSTKQILIEVKILEVELRDEYNQGIQWEALNQGLRYSSFKGSSASDQSVANVLSRDTVYKEVFNTTEDLVSGALSGKASGAGGFGVVMKALSAQGKISVLSSPRLMAINNQKGIIKSGEDRYYVTNVTNLTLGSTTADSKTQSGFDMAPFFSGIALDTTPSILENNEILLHIHPMISRVSDENRKLTIDGKITDIPSAKIQSREADTIVKAYSGDIIILGGMTQNYVKMNESGLPITPPASLSKFASLFAAKQGLNKKVELIILIKPTIINNAQNMESLGTYNTQSIYDD